MGEEKALDIHVKGLIKESNDKIKKIFSEEEAEIYRIINNTLRSVLHEVYEDIGDVLKDQYYPFNPKPQRKDNLDYKPLQVTAKQFIENFIRIIESANFIKVPKEKLEEGIILSHNTRLKLDDAYENLEYLELFYKGFTIEPPKKKWYQIFSRIEEEKKWFFQWNKLEPQKIYKELFIVSKEKDPEENLEEKVTWASRAKTRIRHFKHGLQQKRVNYMETGKINIKYLNNARDELFYDSLQNQNYNPGFWKTVLHAFTGGATSFGKVAFNVCVSTVVLGPAAVGLVVVGIAKSGSKLLNIRTEEERKKAKALADSLGGQYDSAISAGIDEAEKSDQREMIIGYNILLSRTDKDTYLTQWQVKQAAEHFLKDCTERDCSYDVEDALDVLVCAGLVETKELYGKQCYRAVEPKKALEILEYIDNQLNDPKYTEQEQCVHKIFDKLRKQYRNSSGNC